MAEQSLQVNGKKSTKITNFLSFDDVLVNNRKHTRTFYDKICLITELFAWRNWTLFSDFNFRHFGYKVCRLVIFVAGGGSNNSKT